MLIGVLELFKIGIGPSSSHTVGPMVAAADFAVRIGICAKEHRATADARVRCALRGSLAYTGKGHATDRAVVLGLHGLTPPGLASEDVDALITRLWQTQRLPVGDGHSVAFVPDSDIVFDCGEPLPEHPNGLVFELLSPDGEILLSETYFSIGGGFVSTLTEMRGQNAPRETTPTVRFPYPFDSAASMRRCGGNGLRASGTLPGSLALARRAKGLHDRRVAAGRMVVTAPTNGAAGVVPSVLYYLVTHEGGAPEQVRNFLLTAAAIGGIIKHRSSISGAEGGCQGEVGSAASMAAAGLCAMRGGTPQQIENAAEIALEHHLGMTRDPVNGLVQIPCIERNGFGAIKAFAAIRSDRDPAPRCARLSVATGDVGVSRARCAQAALALPGPHRVDHRPTALREPGPGSTGPRGLTTRARPRQ